MGGKTPIEPDHRSVATGIRFGPQQAERLRRIANAKGRPQAELIRQGLDELLDRLDAEDAVAS